MYDYWLMVQQNIVKYQQKHCQPEANSDTQARDIRKTSMKPISACSQQMVMLTNFVESNQQKCSIYFPIETNEIIFITDSNEKFENDRLAALYKIYLNTVSTDSHALSRCEFQIELTDESIECNPFSEQPIKVEEIPRKNYFLISNCGLRMKDGFSIRKFICLYIVTDKSQKANTPSYKAIKQTLCRFTCYHYWFPDWPDHHSPEDVGLLLDMSLHLLDSCCDNEFGRDDGCSFQKEQKSNSIFEPILGVNNDIEPLPIIHCSAGIGRTGCLAAILNGVRQIRTSILLALKPWNCQLTSHSVAVMRASKNYINVDVLGIVCNLRLQRGGMVQNSEQYELIHKALCLYQARIDAELLSWDESI